MTHLGVTNDTYFSYRLITLHRIRGFAIMRYTNLLLTLTYWHTLQCIHTGRVSNVKESGNKKKVIV